jgi:uncharacterized sulfatase
MNFDLFATALALAGAPVPADRPIDGRDLMPMLAGGKSPHETIFFFQGRRLEAVRAGDWKYHRRHPVAVYPYTSPYSGQKQGPWLFDVKDDPSESYDCSLHYPDKVKEMEGLIGGWK